VTVPPRTQELGFSFDKPSDFALIDLPAETLNVEDPLAFLPLGIAMAQYGAVVFSVGARPAYSDGTVSQWLTWLAKERGLDPSEVEAEAGFHYRAAGCWGMQVQDGLTLRSRIVLMEDGGRMINLSCLAPVQLWPSVEPTLMHMLRSFRLTTEKGGTVALAPSEPPGAGAPAEPEPEPVVIEDTGAPETFANLALADDAGALDPEHELNARLRDQGAGLAPNVLHVDARQKKALVAGGAIVALFEVPFGWHVSDDGKRTLVFDAAGKIQINLRRHAREGEDDKRILKTILRGLKQDWPQLDSRLMVLGGYACLGVRNVSTNDEPIEQAYLIVPARHDEVLQVRVTASPDEITRAVNLAELVIKSMRYLDEGNRDPWWWSVAQELEKQDRLDEAEALLERSIQHLGVDATIAHLYELRAVRLNAGGDAKGAEEAITKSIAAMRRMASGATSGGEGAALSLQADEHEKRLRGR
jgi:hypothetical protein